MIKNDIYVDDNNVLYFGNVCFNVGDTIGTYCQDSDENTGYPIALGDGSSYICDDMDRDEFSSMLKSVGFETETDDTGLVLIRVSNGIKIMMLK